MSGKEPDHRSGNKLGKLVLSWVNVSNSNNTDVRSCREMDTETEAAMHNEGQGAHVQMAPVCKGEAGATAKAG